MGHYYYHYYHDYYYYYYHFYHSHSTPLHSTPLHSTPLYSTPLHSTPLHSTPPIIPKPSPRDQVPVDLPPMTGSFSSVNLKVVPDAPSKVTREPVLAPRLAFEAPIQSISMWKSPWTPSAHTSMSLILLKYLLSTHTSDLEGCPC